MVRSLAVVLAVAALGGATAACGTSGATGGRLGVVAAFYPLAWAADQVGGGAVEVEDLTPKGGEPHDLSLSASQTADIQRAEVVLIIGHGFQPQVEAAAREASGRVLDVTQGLHLLPSQEKGLTADPHVWLDPVLMEHIVDRVATTLGTADAPSRGAFREAGQATIGRLRSLDSDIRTGLAACRYRTVIATHQAFGYFADRYDLAQLGVTGLTPEAEPTADAIRRAAEAVRQGKAHAVFYELSDEGRRVGESVASDIGVDALPLYTLESDPAPNDYVSAMKANLASLRKGLSCAT